MDSAHYHYVSIVAHTVRRCLLAENGYIYIYIMSFDNKSYGSRLNCCVFKTA